MRECREAIWFDHSWRQPWFARRDPQSPVATKIFPEFGAIFPELWPQYFQKVYLGGVFRKWMRGRRLRCFEGVGVEQVFCERLEVLEQVGGT